jgi:hypothetical protein
MHQKGLNARAFGDASDVSCRSHGANYYVLKAVFPGRYLPVIKTMTLQ